MGRRNKEKGMGKFKVHSSNNFTIINNSVFYNRDISWKAKGILTQMLSLPETWDYTEAGLSTLSTDGLTSTRSALKELEKAGYLIRSFTRDEQGRIVDIDYDIFEIPVQNDQQPFLENPKTDSTIMRSPDATDSPIMRTPVTTDSPTMRQPVNGYSENGENKPFTGHPLLGFPFTGFPKSENKHNKELTIINNQSNKEPTTEPDTDDRNVGLPENGSARNSDSKFPEQSSPSAGSNSGMTCEPNPTTEISESNNISCNYNDSDIQKNNQVDDTGFEPESVPEPLSDITTGEMDRPDSDECGSLNIPLSNQKFDLTHHDNEKANQSLSVSVDKEKMDAGTTVQGSHLYPSEKTSEQKDTTISLYTNIDKDKTVTKLTADDLSNRNGDKPVSVQIPYDRTESDLSMDDQNKRNIASDSNAGNTVQTYDYLTNEDSKMPVHDYEMENASGFVSIDKEKKEMGSVRDISTDSDSFVNPYMNYSNEQGEIEHTHNNQINTTDRKIDCEDQIITDERYKRREKEHQTGMWNTYEIDGYFFAEPLSSQKSSNTEKRYTQPPKQREMESNPVSYQNMVIPARQEMRAYSSFEELCNDTKDILNHPYMTDVLKVIHTILNSQESYVQVKNTNIPKNEFDHMLLSIPKNEILDIAHAVFENRYGIRNQFSYIKTLLYITAMKRFGKDKTYTKQGIDSNSANSVRTDYTNIYRNGQGTKFSNFEQRNYDYDALERQLLQRSYNF